MRTIYQHCKRCQAVQPGVKSLLGRKCGVCGTRAWGWNYRECGECGSRLYGPAKLLESLPFPCHPPVEKAAEDELPAREEPVLIQWNDPSGNALLHVLHLNGPLPPLSKIVVRQNQRVICENGGERQLFGPGEHVMTRESLLQRELDKGIGGRIIFLDDRTGGVPYIHTLSVKGGDWTVQLPFTCDFAFDCTREERLLRRRIPLESDEKARDALLDAITAELREQLERALVPVEDAAALAEAADEADVVRGVKRMVTDDVVAGVTERINARLTADYGLMLTELRLELAGVQALRAPVLIKMICTRCGRTEEAPRSRKGERDSFLCSRCVWKESFCPWCQSFRQIDRVTGECGRCGAKVK